MPKKFKGENSKAAEARARKSAQKEAEEQQKKQQLEDEYWKDDDKHLLKKQQRKEEKEKKRVEQLERKKEVQKLAEDEVAAIKPVKQQQQMTAAKLTRADIEAHQEKLTATSIAASQKNDADTVTATEQPLEENVNRLQVEGEVARTVEDAIQLLSTKEEDVDKHPEKRMKAAYLAFEEKNLPILKAENPNLRLSQLRQMLKKDWVKSPENPLNQRLLKA
jgi:hypothetical protein